MVTLLLLPLSRLPCYYDVAVSSVNGIWKYIAGRH